MNVSHVMEVVEEIAKATPLPIARALENVEVIVCRFPRKEAGMTDDARGMYEGTFPSESDDELEQEPPEGRILLVASNLRDKQDARDVLLHEMAHALGLDETEVAGLGL
jgi:predicted Zn-dependent protease with MMP-like domain